MLVEGWGRLADNDFGAIGRFEVGIVLLGIFDGKRLSFVGNGELSKIVKWGEMAVLTHF